MLTIRADQLRLLARPAFADELLSHARDAAPDVCNQMTAAHLRSVIEYCLARCDHYRIDDDYDIMRYLNLMLVFGVTFDKDEPWAAEPLACPDPSARMDLLMDCALMQNPTISEVDE